MATTVTLKPNAIDISGSTSGTTTLQATAVAGTTTLTLPAATDTLVGKATTDTLTNKTLTTPSVSSPTISDGTANGVAYLNGSKVLTTGSALVFDGTNLGVGVTPSAWGSAWKAYQYIGGSMASPNGSNNLILQNAYNDGTNYRYVGTAGASSYQQSSGSHIWNQAASGTAGNAITFTQAMTLDASGNLLVGTTSVNSVGVISVDFLGQTKQGITLDDTWASTGGVYILFRNSAGDTAGRIDHNGTTTVAYTTSSDYRLKENIAPMTGALAKVLQLNPVTYKWKSDGTDGQGFIAHELQAIVPDAVVGAKDAMNEDGSINPQGIDTSFLVATLTAAIQEQQALITQLTARITALESA